MLAGGGLPRDQACARREARGRIELSRFARGVSGSLPMLAPARSRCLFRRGVGPTFLHKRGHSRLFLVIRDRLQIGVCGPFVTEGGWVSWLVGSSGTRPARAEEARGRRGVRSAPTGRRKPARGATPGSGNWGQVSKSGLAADELGVHAGVNASLGDEAFVSAAFDDATVVEHED